MGWLTPRVMTIILLSCVQICDFDSIARANRFAGSQPPDLVSVDGHPDTLCNSISRWQLYRAFAVSVQLVAIREDTAAAL